MIYDLSKIEQKAALATTSNFHFAFTLAIAEVAQEIISETYQPYPATQADVKLKARARQIYNGGLPKVDYKLSLPFLASFDSGQVDDEQLTNSTTFNILKNKTKEWFELYAGVTADDKVI